MSVHKYMMSNEHTPMPAVVHIYKTILIRYACIIKADIHYVYVVIINSVSFDHKTRFIQLASDIFSFYNDEIYEAL